MIHRTIFLILLGLDVLILLFLSSNVSISAHEAKLLYGDFSIVQFLTESSLIIFGNNDFALRLPMIFFHILSTLLLYCISVKYLDDSRNRLWLVLFFILLPGVLSSAILVDSASLVIFSLLLFVYVYENFDELYTYPLLILFCFLDNSFIYLFASLLIFGLYKKRILYSILNVLLLVVSFIYFGFESEGSPEGHLIDTIGLYSAIFTPIIFVYLFYILYRRLLAKQVNLIWFVAAVPLLFSLLLSFRQEIVIEEFAPYLILALPLAAETFYASYRVRLKMFRKRYKALFTISLMFLFFNFFVVMLNKEFYLLIEDPSKHFARKMHIAKDLSSELKNMNVNCIHTDDNMGMRLRFYGIQRCNDYSLIEKDIDVSSSKNVTISYRHRIIYEAFVTNINNR